MPLLTLTAAQATVVANALADAEQYRHLGVGWCIDCAASPDGACRDHLKDLQRAATYRGTAAELDLAPAKSGRPQCSEHRGRPQSAKP